MTYNPNLGRWLQVDPIGFDAGDMNLYRFVGNNPVSEVDPSGLKADFVSKGQLNASMPGFTGAEMATLIAAIREAVERLDKALSMLTEHWDELENLSTFAPAGGKPFVSGRYRALVSEYTTGDDIWGYTTSTYRKYYIYKIKQILNPLKDKDHCLPFKSDRSPATPNGRQAYVIYHLFVIPGSTIHITNAFFEAALERQIDVLVHELARRIGFDEENTENLLYDVYEWDNMINFLASKYDELISKKKG